MARTKNTTISSIKLKPAETFDATTTHKADFTAKESGVVNPIKPRSAGYMRSNEPFNETSTHRADFDVKNIDPVKSIRPESILYKSDEPMNTTTTHKQDYKIFNNIQPSKLIKQQASRHLSSQPFEVIKKRYKYFKAVTENQAMFDQKFVSASKSFRPTNQIYRPNSQPMNDVSTYTQGYTQKYGNIFIMLKHIKVKPPEPIRQKSNLFASKNPFDSQTIQQTEFTKKYVKPPEPIRQRSNLFASKNPFDSQTVNRSDFTVKQNKICPAELVLTRRDRSFKRSINRNGHQYYRKIVGITRSPNSPNIGFRRMSPIRA